MIGFAISQHIIARDHATFDLVENDRASELAVKAIFVMGDYKGDINTQFAPLGVTRAYIPGLALCLFSARKVAGVMV